MKMGKVILAIIGVLFGIFILWIVWLLVARPIQLRKEGSQAIPLFPGAQLVTSAIGGPDFIPYPKNHFKATYQLSANVSSRALHDFYQAELTASGWQNRTQLYNDPEYPILIFSKSGRSLSFHISCKHGSVGGSETSFERCESPGSVIEINTTYTLQ